MARYLPSGRRAAAVGKLLVFCAGPGAGSTRTLPVGRWIVLRPSCANLLAKTNMKGDMRTTMALIQNARNLDKLQPPPHCSRSSRSQRTFDGAAPAVHTKNSDRAKFDGVSGHDQKHGQKFDLGPICREVTVIRNFRVHFPTDG
jgi:hypothetical protein